MEEEAHEILKNTEHCGAAGGVDTEWCEAFRLSLGDRFI